MTSLEYFRLLAPEFASVIDATVNQWLSMAGNVASTEGLDAERSAMALAMYAAHMLKLSQSNAGGGVGAITSEREGDLQRSYSEIKGGDTYLGKTGYGQQYADITRAAFGSAIMTRAA